MDAIQVAQAAELKNAMHISLLLDGPNGLIVHNAIQGLIKKAYGYRNRARFKTDIFLHLGGFDLYPAQ